MLLFFDRSNFYSLRCVELFLILVSIQALQGITALYTPHSSFLPEEGKRSCGKGAGGKGMLLSLPDEEATTKT